MMDPRECDAMARQVRLEAEDCMEESRGTAGEAAERWADAAAALNDAADAFERAAHAIRSI